MRRAIPLLLLPILVCAVASAQDDATVNSLRAQVLQLKQTVEKQKLEIEELKEQLEQMAERVEILEERATARASAARPTPGAKTGTPAEEEDDDGVVTIRDTTPDRPATPDFEKKEEAKKPEDRTPATDAPGVEFRVLKRTNIIIGTTIRISYRIRVESKPTREDVEFICTNLIQTRETSPINAVYFRFYTPDPAKPNRTKDLAASAEWAPEGDWDKADTVQPGHYETHKLRIKMSK